MAPKSEVRNRGAKNLGTRAGLAANDAAELCEAPDHFNHISASTERTNKATGRADEGVARLN